MKGDLTVQPWRLYILQSPPKPTTLMRPRAWILRLLDKGTT